MGENRTKEICALCKLPFTEDDPKTHFNQKYHIKRGCREQVRRKQNCDRVRRFRKKYGITEKKGRSEPLGSGKLGPHRRKNFETEADKIRREFRRIGLR